MDRFKTLQDIQIIRQLGNMPKYSWGKIWGIVEVKLGA